MLGKFRKVIVIFYRREKVKCFLQQATIFSNELQEFGQRMAESKKKLIQN